MAEEQHKIQAKVVKDKNLAPALVEANMKLLKACNFNIALLTPFYFPRMFDEAPMSFRDYPQMYPSLSLQFGLGYVNNRGSRQIGKTQSIKTSMLVLADMIPGYRQLYFVPLSEQLKTFADGFTANHEAFRFRVKRSKMRDNLYYKEVLSSDRRTRSTIRLEYILTSASKVRGQTQDGLIGDEMQDFDPNLFPEIDEIIQASVMRRRLFGGTSLYTGTFLELLHQEGSCSTWGVECPHCKFENWADLSCEYTEAGITRNVFDMIQPEGPCCIKCGRPLNPRNGYWMHANPKALELMQFSFHTAQVLVPGVYENQARWFDIYQKKNNQDPRKFLQENLGIPVEDGEREITEKQLREICTLPGTPDIYVKKARNAGYRVLVSGADWGGSDHQKMLRLKTSFTVHVILGISYDEGSPIDILHFRRYSGMGYEEIVGNIIHDHNRYGAQALGSDVGGGDYYNSLISQAIGTQRHFRFRYMGPDTAYIDVPKTEPQPNTWNLNRTELISDTFGLIRKKSYRALSWEYSGRYLSDIMNLRRHPKENTQTGRTTFLYHRDATKADDTLHAIVFGTVLARMLAGENMFAGSEVYRDFHRKHAGLTVAAPPTQASRNRPTRH